MEFPIYRKYFNGKSYFRIRNHSEFDELIIIGKNYSLVSYTAKILPDRVLIEDMIQKLNNHWLESTAEEFELTLDNCKKNLKNTD